MRGWTATGIRWGIIISGTTDTGRARPTEALGGYAPATREDNSITDIGKANADALNTTIVGIAIATIATGANTIATGIAIITDL